MSNCSMTTKDLRQKCIVLKERIEVMKKEGPALLEEITNNISKKEFNQCILILNIGNLENHLKNVYKIMEEQNEISSTTISRLEELECRVEELELQLELQANETKFFSSYRDWVKHFINTIIINELGERKWRLVDSGLDLKKRGLTLTQEEQDCINDLKNLLDGFGMITNDLRLLQQVMYKSNVKFHSNNQTLEEAKMKLRDPVPIDLQVYKPPLEKALEAIGKRYQSYIKR